MHHILAFIVNLLELSCPENEKYRYNIGYLILESCYLFDFQYMHEDLQCHSLATLGGCSLLYKTMENDACFRFNNI